jgi:hypothetical protein
MKYANEIKRLLNNQKNLFDFYFEMVLTGDFFNMKEALDRIYNMEKIINILEFKLKKSKKDDTIVLASNELVIKFHNVTKYEYLNSIGCKENYILSIAYQKYLRILKSKGHDTSNYDHQFYKYYMSNLSRGVKNKTIFMNLRKDYISFINKD